MISPSTIADPLLLIRGTARPIMFRTGLREAPISTWGTCFLVGYRGKIFAVTAAHVIRDAKLSDVVICAAEGRSQAMTLANGFKVQQVLDDDYEVDLHIFETSLTGLKKRDRERGRIVNLSLVDVTDWKGGMHTSLYFTCGYPSEMNEVNYETSMVETKQVLIIGKYLEAARMAYQHVLKVDNPLEMSSFGGMSGSPVFCVEFRISSKPIVRFCGIALTGSAGSCLVHFLEAETVLRTLDIVLQTDRPGGDWVSELPHPR